MTAPARAAQPPSKEQRIAHLFLTGYGLDGICERGVAGGWTRAEALDVAEQQGWTLDSSGRIPRAEREKFTDEVERAQAARQAPGVAHQPPALALPGWAATLVEARKHPLPRIQKAARRIDGLLEQLAAAMGAADEEAKTRARLVEVEAEREQLRAQLRKKPAAQPATATAATAGQRRAAVRQLKPINHGTWGGWQAHRARDETPCADCELGKDEHMAGMREKSRAAS